MKWGRKKLSSESASSRNSLISNVFPVSWLCKFKQKSGDVGAKPVKVKQERKQNSAFVDLPKCISSRGGRFYGGEGDAFWRLSFDEEGSDQGKTSRGDLSSVWSNSDDKLEVPPSVCQSCGSHATTLMGNEEIHKFNNLILDARKMKELQRNGETAPDMEILKTEEEVVTKKLRVKTKEIKSESENHRKSLYIRRELQARKMKPNSKVKVGSPRIKALEDMRKAKLKMKKGKEKKIDGRTSLESFAVVKRSFHPQKDFRDSMIEMILEKRFSKPEELEELLACYLTLNSGEFHDLIIKVFRQVWLGLNQACFDELQNENYCDN